MAGRSHQHRSNCQPENPTLDDPLLKYGHLKFSIMAAKRHIGFDPTGSSTGGSADPKTPPQNQRWSELNNWLWQWIS